MSRRHIRKLAAATEALQADGSDEDAVEQAAPAVSRGFGALAVSDSDDDSEGDGSYQTGIRTTANVAKSSDSLAATDDGSLLHEASTGMPASLHSGEPRERSDLHQQRQLPAPIVSSVPSAVPTPIASAAAPAVAAPWRLFRVATRLLNPSAEFARAFGAALNDAAPVARGGGPRRAAVAPPSLLVPAPADLGPPPLSRAGGGFGMRRAADGSFAFEPSEAYSALHAELEAVRAGYGGGLTELRYQQPGGEWLVGCLLARVRRGVCSSHHEPLISAPLLPPSPPLTHAPSSGGPAGSHHWRRPGSGCGAAEGALRTGGGLAPLLAAG